MANELKMVFGSSTTVISLAAALASGANTYTGLTGLTGAGAAPRVSTPAAPGFPAAPAGARSRRGARAAAFNLYMVMDDIDGTSDETPEPGASDITYLAKYVGSFVVDNQDVATIKPIVISLEGAQKARFFLANNCGQQASYSSNPLTVKITPFSYMPT